MKKYLLTAITLLIICTANSQSTYTFTGNGYWSQAANWSNNIVPPAILPAGSTINISPAPGDSCVLNTPQTIATGAFLNISIGANFIVSGNLNVNGFPNVIICNQVWMTKNLDVVTYKNGDPIPHITDSAQWAQTTTGAWCWYKNDSAAYAATYGRLYNGYAVNDSRGLTPAGWHVPTNEEWTVLSTCLGGDNIAGGKLKDTILWTPYNNNASNSSGFSALPGGARIQDVYYGYDFRYIENYGFWWSSTGFNPTSNLSKHLEYYVTRFFNDTSSLMRAFSVRCIKDGPPQVPSLYTNGVTGVTSNSAICGGTITSSYGSVVTARGVCWSTNHAPTLSDFKTLDASGGGSYMSNLTGLNANTTYYVRAYAINLSGTAYGNEYSFTTDLIPDSSFIDPRDSQVYTYRRIGTQLWMTQNLNFATDSSWCYYDSTGLCGTYGRLYNWLSAKTAAPPGWHLPTDEEWFTLLNNYNAGDAQYPNYRSGDLKSLTLWFTPNSNATNKSRFNALPGGLRLTNGIYSNKGIKGFWWSASDSSASDASVMLMQHDNDNLYNEFADKHFGFSIRCVKDELPIVSTSTISLINQNSAVCGGTVLNDLLELRSLPGEYAGVPVIVQQLPTTKPLMVQVLAISSAIFPC